MSDVLATTLNLLRELRDTDVLFVATPIVLSSTYRAMAEPVGILNTRKEVGAFAEGTVGAENIPEFAEFGDRIMYVDGKVGFNAFATTPLDEVLRSRGIRHVLVCGMVTSLCIDSTGRAAYERGFDVLIISDCSSARTALEQDFYCSSVFPLYARTITAEEFATELRQPVSS